MKIHNLLYLTPTLVFAHPGHPGPADHGDITHALLSLGTALVILTATWLILRTHNRRKALIPVRKDPPNG